METRRGVYIAPSDAPPSSTFDVAKSCFKATGASEEDIEALISKNEVPDAMKLSGGQVTYAWVYIIDIVIRKLGKPITTCLKTCLSALDENISLPSRVTSLLAKTASLAKSCDNDTDVMSKLHKQAKQLYLSSSSFIGDECETEGINATNLTTTFSPTPKLTTMMVYELEMYRTSQRKPQMELLDWLCNILGVQLSSMGGATKIPNILSKIADIKRRKQQADHKRDTKTLMEMRQQRFCLALTSEIENTTVKMTAAEKARLEIAASKTTTQNLKAELKETKKQLNRSTTQLKRALASEGHKEKLLHKQAKKVTECKRLKLKLDKQREVLQEKESELDSYCQPYNVKRREQTKNNTIAKHKATIAEQKTIISQMQSKIADQNEKAQISSSLLKKRKESRDYFQEKTQCLRESESVKQVKDFNKIEKQNGMLKAENRTLKNQLDSVTAELDVLRQNKPHLREENGEISNEVWECYMRLMALGVSASTMSQVAHAVLTIICKYDVSLTELPKPTSCKKVPALANVISSYHVASELSKTQYATQHSDGTSRDGAKVVDFEVTVDGGRTLTSGILPVATGDSDTQLSTFKFLMKKLAGCLDTENMSKTAKELIAKIQSTMGDQAATQKSFNEKLENYRSSIVPDVIQNWENLEPDVQDSLLTMNHFFCNLHALIGFATYSDNGMQTLEDKWRKDIGEQLGTETLREFQNKSGEYAWSHTDSATQRLVRTACSAFPPGGDQKSGAIGSFESYRRMKQIPNMEIKPFRANRFNIFFENAAGVFYHRHHLVDMFDGGYVKASNKLLRAVLADMKSTKLIAGVRALGIMCIQFTEPYWRMIERRDITVLDMSKHIQESFKQLQEWTCDASPLLKANHPPVFVLPTGEQIKPISNHVSEALFSAVDLDVDTQEALQVICASMVKVYERRFRDQLQGGKYSGQSSSILQDQTKDTPKSNKRGENDFGYWAWVKGVKPTMTDMNVEGQCMYRLNSSDIYINKLKQKDPAEYRKVMKAALRRRREMCRLYKELSLKIETEKIKRLEEHRLEEQKKRRKQQEKVAARKKLIDQHGGECSTREDVEFYINTTHLKTQQTHILKQHIVHMKETYHLDGLHDHKKLTLISNKTVQQLKEDLIILVEYVHGHADSLVREDSGEGENDNHVDESADGDSTTNSDDSFTDTDSNEDDENNITSGETNSSCTGNVAEVHDGTLHQNLKDLSVGELVAAAWEDDWWPGEVLEVHPEQNTALINFMQRKSGNKFTWAARKPDIQVTCLDAILYRGVILVPDLTLRFHTVENELALTRMYNVYYNRNIVH